MTEIELYNLWLKNATQDPVYRLNLRTLKMTMTLSVTDFTVTLSLVREV